MYSIEGRLRDAGLNPDMYIDMVNSIVCDVLAELSDHMNERGQWKALHMIGKDKQDVSAKAFSLAMEHIAAVARPYGGAWHSEYSMQKYQEGTSQLSRRT